MLDVWILNSAETLLCVLSNNLPDACPVIDFRQIQEAQTGGYSDTCLLTVPATHSDSAYITEGNYILFQDNDGLWHEYKIVQEKRIDDQTGSYIQASGEHAFYELLGDWIDDIRPTTTTASLAVIEALTNTRWSIGTGDDLGNNSTRIYKTSVLSALVQIATQWGGELRFYVTVGGNLITGRKVDILTQRGSVTGKRFEYRKDLTNIRVTTDISNLATALIGRGKGELIEGGTETTDPTYGRRLEFTDEVWATPGDSANKPAAQNWIGDDTAKAAYGPGGRHIFGTVTFDECTDAAELLELTYAELQTRKAPLVTYEMDVITLENVSGLEHEAVRFGDTVNVINTAYTTITGTARVMYIDRSYVDMADCKITLGNYIPSVSNRIVTLQAQQQAIQDRLGIWDRANIIEEYSGSLGLSYVIDLLQTQLASTTSYFYTDASGNFIFENAASTKALKLGAGILAIANTKTLGEWNWTTFGTGDGFVADKIISGTLSSALIFAGTLQAASGTFTDLVAGVTGAQRLNLGYDEFNDPFIKVYDNSNVLQLTINKNGVVFGSFGIMRKYTIGDRTGVGTFIA